MTDSASNRTIDQIADEASVRPFLHSASQLCAPILGCIALREARDSTHLCTWGYFNPFGPTFENLLVVESSSWLLYRQSMNPFSQLDIVYGAPLEIANDQRDPVHLAAAELLASNGGEIPLFQGLPSYIFAGDEKDLNPHLREYFLQALALLDAADLAADCDAIRRHWCRPWDLASEQLERAVSHLATKSENLLSNASHQPIAIDPELFDRWWSLVYESDHAVACFEQLRNAWEGAIEFQSNSENALHAMSWERAQEFQKLSTRRNSRVPTDADKHDVAASVTPLHETGRSLNEINGYKLNSRTDQYPEDLLAPFGEESYEWAASYGIERQFPNEAFYWASNNVLFGHRCTQAIIASASQIIYKIAFRYHATSEGECASFRRAAYEHLSTIAGKEQERKDFRDVRLLIWQSSEGNAILEMEGYDTSILLTSSAIRRSGRRSLLPRFRDLLRACFAARRQ